MSDVEVAVAAAQAGAAVVRVSYGMPLARFEKGARNDFATDADVAAEEAILEVLRGARPDDAYRGEETGASGNASSGRTWLVDPLCGTQNFAAQTPLVAVNVALSGPDGVRVAACADPLADELFWTDGRGAYRRHAGTDTALVPSAVTCMVELNIGRPGPDPHPFQPVALLAEPGFLARFELRVVGTSLALAWLAAGRLAGHVSTGYLRDSVHFAAGIALCQAAGCVVTGLRGEPVHDGVGGLLAAADADTHAALLDLVAPYLPGA